MWKSALLFCALDSLAYIATVGLWLFFNINPLGGGGGDTLHLLLLLLVIFIVSVIVARRRPGSWWWAVLPPFFTLLLPNFGRLLSVIYSICAGF